MVDYGFREGTFHELEVYKLARHLGKEVFMISKTFPFEERFSITDQIRRSSRSIGAQVAEAWAKRTYKAHFISKLTDADGEQQETQHWLFTALECQYITPELVEKLVSQYEEVGRMLQSMIHKADLFCKKSKQ